MATRNADPVFETVDINIGGITYTLRELNAGEYDECLNVATNAESGDVDMVMMVKLMLIKSIQTPDLTDVQLMALPYKVSRSLKRAVSQLHWAGEQDNTAAAAEEEEGDEGTVEKEGAGPNP
jgi:uncharacterized membrane protein YukC